LFYIQQIASFQTGDQHPLIEEFLLDGVRILKKYTYISWFLTQILTHPNLTLKNLDKFENLEFDP